MPGLRHDGAVASDRYVDDVRLADAICAARQGDENAFRTVYRAVHPRLLAYVRTLVGAAEAEDVTSEAWLQVTRDIDRFRGDADRFRGWAARIARNRALDHLRRLDRRPVRCGDESELADLAAPSDTAGEALDALATERERERDAIVAAAALARSLGLEVHGGHGLNYNNVTFIATIPEIVELNIGHSIIARAVIVGIEQAVREMKQILTKTRG